MTNHKNGDSRRQIGHQTTLCIKGETAPVKAMVIRVTDQNVWYRTVKGDVYRVDRAVGKMFKEQCYRPDEKPESFDAEVKRGEYEESGRVDRKFLVIVSRGRGFTFDPGDSLTAGFGLAEDEGFTARLGAELARRFFDEGTRPVLLAFSTSFSICRTAWMTVV